MSVAIHPQVIPADASSPFLSNISNTDKFRNYEAEARDSVKELYRLNHANQTLDFVLAKKAEYSKLNKLQMGIWEALEKMDSFVDDSDPDLALPQIVHALQTAEPAGPFRRPTDAASNRG